MSVLLQSPEKSQLRIVSLIASATEIVHALGLGRWLVGRSHECDYPPQVTQLPCVTRPRFDVSGDSRQIDALVRETLAGALSVYEVFDDVLEALQPTHIVTQIQCDVCAVSLRDVERSIAKSLRSQPQIISLNPDSLSDIWDDMRRVGRATGVDAEPAIRRLKERMERISCNYRGRLRPTVACLEWLEPLMAAGNWTPELIELAGGSNLVGVAGEHSSCITWDELKRADPDVLIAAPCGFSLERTLSEMHWLTSRPGYSDLKAVRSGRVYVGDGNQFFNRPGPRVLETVEILEEILHGAPKTRPRPTWSGTGYVRLATESVKVSSTR